MQKTRYLCRDVIDDKDDVADDEDGINDEDNVKIISKYDMLKIGSSKFSVFSQNIGNLAQLMG